MDFNTLRALPNLTELTINCFYGDKKDTDTLRYLTKLRKLDLQHCKIWDISSLQDLTQLEELNLYDNDIVNIPNLRGLTRLEQLDLSNNRIVDVGGLSATLKQLDLSNNRIVDITSLQGLTRLEELEISSNRIVDIGGLSATLKQLNLSNNKIVDMTSLQGLTRLEELEISSNNIVDVSGLPTQLKRLNLDSNNIVDACPLVELLELELEFLEIKNNPIRAEKRIVLFLQQECSFFESGWAFGRIFRQAFGRIYRKDKMDGMTGQLNLHFIRRHSTVQPKISDDNRMPWDQYEVERAESVLYQAAIAEAEAKRVEDRAIWEASLFGDDSSLFGDLCGDISDDDKISWEYKVKKTESVIDQAMIAEAEALLAATSANRAEDHAEFMASLSSLSSSALLGDGLYSDDDY